VRRLSICLLSSSLWVGVGCATTSSSTSTTTADDAASTTSSEETEAPLSDEGAPDIPQDEAHGHGSGGHGGDGHGGDGHGGQKSPARQGQVLKGQVVETLDAAGYTYVLLDDGGQRTWVALPASELTVGQTILVSVSVVMHGFHSKTLSRTFDEIIFGTLTSQPAPSTAPQGSYEL